MTDTRRPAPAGAGRRVQPRLDESLTGSVSHEMSTSDLSAAMPGRHQIGTVAGFGLECWPTSRRNGGRLPVGITGRLRRNTQAGSSTPPGSPRQSPSLSRSWSPVKCSSRLLHIRKEIREPVARRVESTPKGFSEGGDVALGKSSHVREHTAVQGAISLRTVAEAIPKSLATRAGLNPARTAARTMLALAGGTSGNGAALRMILVVTGRVSSATGAGLGLPSPEAEPIPRRRASPSAARIRTIRSSFPS